MTNGSVHDVVGAGRVEFGVVLSQFTEEWAHVQGDAAAAEDAGLDSAWLVDHLLNVREPAGAVFEGWSALAAIAGSTSRVRLGHLVTCMSFRNVGLLAKMAATVDHASGGRLELGLGAGWYEAEYEAFGFPYGTARDRFRAFAESLDALVALFLGGPVDYEGEFVRLSDAYCHPVPVQRPRPPITVGAGGTRMRRLTGARADAWNCPAGLLADVGTARELVLEAAGDRPVRTTIQVPVAVGRTTEEAEAALRVGTMHLAWMGDLDEVGITGTIDRALEKVAHYRSHGVDGFLAVLPGSRQRPDFIAAYGELAARARDEGLTT